LTQTTKI